MLGCERARRAIGHKDIDVEPKQLGRQLGQAIVVAVGPSEFEDHVLTFDITKIAKTGLERLHSPDVARRGGGRSA
jgi:hypothetical protein